MWSVSRAGLAAHAVPAAGWCHRLLVIFYATWYQLSGDCCMTILTLGEFVLIDPGSCSPVQNVTRPPVRPNSRQQLSSSSGQGSCLCVQSLLYFVWLWHCSSWNWVPFLQPTMTCTRQSWYLLFAAFHCWEDFSREISQQSKGAAYVPVSLSGSAVVKNQGCIPLKM